MCGLAILLLFLPIKGANLISAMIKFNVQWLESLAAHYRLNACVGIEKNDYMRIKDIKYCQTGIKGWYLITS